MRKKYLEWFFDEFQYPLEAKEALLSGYEAIKNTEIEEHIRLYESGKGFDHIKALQAMNKVAEETGVHQFTVKLLLYILLSQNLKVLYEKNNLKYQVFFDSMCDLKYKLMECYRLHGVWGSFVASWFGGFFDLQRFAFGRLQFEKVKPAMPYDNGNVHIGADEHIINVHIPSAGPLKHEDCILAYKQAYEFYKDSLRKGVMYFQCHSWLLEPALEKIVPESSNIIKFKRDYDVFHVQKKDTFPDAWRVFYVKDDVKIADYPEDTMLQKGIKRYLLEGNTIGYGLGILKFDGERVIF